MGGETGRNWAEQRWGTVIRVYYVRNESTLIKGEG